MIAVSQSGVEPKAKEHFLRCISVDKHGVDSIDRDLDEMIQVDPYNGDPPSRRKDRELARVLSILDSLEVVRGDG